MLLCYDFLVPNNVDVGFLEYSSSIALFKLLETKSVYNYTWSTTLNRIES